MIGHFVDISNSPNDQTMLSQSAKAEKFQAGFTQLSSLSFVQPCSYTKSNVSTASLLQAPQDDLPERLQLERLRHRLLDVDRAAVQIQRLRGAGRRRGRNRRGLLY